MVDFREDEFQCYYFVVQYTPLYKTYDPYNCSHKCECVGFQCIYCCYCMISNKHMVLQLKMIQISYPKIPINKLCLYLCSGVQVCTCQAPDRQMQLSFPVVSPWQQRAITNSLTELYHGYHGGSAAYTQYTLTQLPVYFKLHSLHQLNHNLVHYNCTPGDTKQSKLFEVLIRFWIVIAFHRCCFLDKVTI